MFYLNVVYLSFMLSIFLGNNLTYSDMRTFDELRMLEVFFQEETKRGCAHAYLYELVQHAGNILPRL